MKQPAFTLIEITVYLSLFILIIIALYPIIDNIVGFTFSWEKNQTLQSDFRRISAEIQRKALEAKNMGLLINPQGIFFIIQNNTTSYYVSSSAIYRNDPLGQVILTSTNTVATWTVTENDNLFLIKFFLQDKEGRTSLQATTTFGRLIP